MLSFNKRKKKDKSSPYLPSLAPLCHPWQTFYICVMHPPVRIVVKVGKNISKNVYVFMHWTIFVVVVVAFLRLHSVSLPAIIIFIFLFTFFLPTQQTLQTSLPTPFYSFFSFTHYYKKKKIIFLFKKEKNLF